MILKLLNRLEDENTFFDGFNYLVKKETDLKDSEKSTITYPCSYFTTEKTERVLCFWLMNGDCSQIVRYLVVDKSYSVYLMSDEGKTIERIN